MTKFASFLKDESGASAAEYAIILAVVSAALVTAMGLFGTAIQTAVTSATTAITG